MCRYKEYSVRIRVRDKMKVTARRNQRSRLANGGPGQLRRFRVHATRREDAQQRRVRDSGRKGHGEYEDGSGDVSTKINHEVKV